MIIDRIVRRTLEQKGLDPDALIERNKAVYAEEEADMAAARAAESAEVI